MRYLWLFVLLMMFILLPVPAYTQSDSATFRVPFAFVAGDTDFPSGSCEMRQVLVSASVMQMTCGGALPGFISLVPGKTYVDKTGGARSYAILIFQRVGNHYFLREYKPRGFDSTSTTQLAKRRLEVVTTLLSSNQPETRIILASVR